MDSQCKDIIWGQFGAALDALENAINACPEELWSGGPNTSDFWYRVSHTLFWLDFYLSESTDGFRPPEPFGLEEMDPAGVMPDRVYTKAELLAYLKHGREKGRTTIKNMSQEEADRIYAFGSVSLSRAELLLYNLRHVQHHTGQLNLLLRKECNIGSRWCFTAREKL